MAAVKFYSDTEANIAAKAVEIGAILVAYDTHKVYFDTPGGRFEVGEASGTGGGEAIEEIFISDTEPTDPNAKFWIKVGDSTSSNDTGSEQE